MATAQHIQRAQALPPRLLNFFKKYPPTQATSTSTPPAQTIEVAENTSSSSDPNAAASIQRLIAASSPDEIATKKPNPFTPWKNPRTGKWHPPIYSLRQQAALFKEASANHVLSLMPLSNKHPEVKEQKRIEHGLRVQGTGEGRKVKGKYWERTLRQRMEKRRVAMEGMPEMIRQWKQLGHGRGWKKWPK